MRVVKALVLPLVVVALIAFGATYDLPQPPPGPLDAAELRWIGRARDWLAVAVPARCDDELVAAPSDRLGAVRDDLRASCEKTDPAQARAGFRAARSRLAGTLRDRRPLPVTAALVGTSRVEPRLGAAVTRLAGGRAVEVRCWSQADWRAVLAEEAALTGSRATRAAVWLPRERSLQLQGTDCGPLVLLARSGLPSARGRRTDLAVALWTVAAAAESVSRRPCVPPAVLATALGARGGDTVELVRQARVELAPLLPPASRRCRTSRPS